MTEVFVGRNGQQFEPDDFIDLVYLCNNLEVEVFEGKKTSFVDGLDADDAAARGSRLESALADGYVNGFLKLRDDEITLAIEMNFEDHDFYGEYEYLEEYSPIHDETIRLLQDLRKFTAFLKVSGGFSVIYLKYPWVESS